MKGVWVEHVTSSKSSRLFRLGRDVYGVTSRVLLMSDLGEGTQLSRRRLVSYGSNVGAGRGCCLSLFWRFVRLGRVT